MQQCGLPCPDKYLSLCPLPYNRCTKTKKYGPNERTGQIPKIELRDEEIATLSDPEFKTLVIRMLTELAEFGCTLEEKNEGYEK